MTKQEVFEKVRDLICKRIERSEGKLTPDMVKLESKFIDDLGADSLDVLELLMAIEEVFELDEIPEDQVEKIVTVEDAVDYLVSQL